MRCAPSRRASHSIPANVVRNGLSDGHGFPRTAATIGRPTQMPIHRSTAGRGEMSPMRNATPMAPYHQMRPIARRADRAVAATGRLSARDRYRWSSTSWLTIVVTMNEAPTAIAAAARYSHSGTGSWNVPPTACADTAAGAAASATPMVPAAARRRLRLMDGEDSDARARRVGGRMELDRELAGTLGDE